MKLSRPDYCFVTARFSGATGLAVAHEYFVVTKHHFSRQLTRAHVGHGLFGAERQFLGGDILDVAGQRPLGDRGAARRRGDQASLGHTIGGARMPSRAAASSAGPGRIWFAQPAIVVGPASSRTVALTGTWNVGGSLTAPMVRDRAALLRHFRFSFLRWAKRNYKWTAGAARYHWFGDCTQCGGNGCELCNETGSGDFWHPHLNILIPGQGYIENVEDYFKPMRIFIAKYLRKLVEDSIQKTNAHLKQYPYDEEYCQLLDYYIMLLRRVRESEMNVNYSYVKKGEEKMMMNRVKYVTRSTFRIFDEEVKNVLHRFRNAVVWGWKKNETEEEEEEALTLQKFCPHCLEHGKKEKIHWSSIDGYKHGQFIKPIYIQDGTTGKRRQSAVFTIKEPGGNDGDYPDGREYSRIRISRATEKTSWGTIMSKSIRHPIL